VPLECGSRRGAVGSVPGGSAVSAAMDAVAPLFADRDQIQQFVDGLFRYADPGGYVSLRAFDQHDHKQPPRLIKPITIDDLEALVDEATRAAEYVANTPPPAVFAPPIATFSNANGAKTTDLANGLTLSLELDSGNTAKARNQLEGIFGPVTVAMASGGEWADPDTGELFTKLHLHWRLTEPTRTPVEHEALRRARDMAARLVGADPTAKPVCHPLRWPGSWNCKSTPRMARIVAHNPDAEINLVDASDALEGAIELAGRVAADMPVSGNPTADPARVASAMGAIPNPGTEVAYDEWIRMGYAVHRASGGTGLVIFDEWSAKSDKYDAAETAAMWRRIGRSILTESKTTRTAGAGSIFFKAKAEGWKDPRTPPPPDSESDYGKTETKPSAGVGRGEAEPPDEQPDGAADQRPEIELRPGQLHIMATLAEAAIRQSGMSVYQRGRSLVHPVSVQLPASDGRTTVSAGLAAISLPGMVDRMSAAARWVKLNRRWRTLTPCDPPQMVGSIILDRAGSWTVPSISGVITTPTLRPDGSVIIEPGYDAATRLYYAADPSLI
jgi:Primase C terminal 2 (PriCT-2)